MWIDAPSVVIPRRTFSEQVTSTGLAATNGNGWIERQWMTYLLKQLANLVHPKYLLAASTVQMHDMSSTGQQPDRPWDRVLDSMINQGSVHEFWCSSMEA